MSTSATESRAARTEALVERLFAAAIDTLEIASVGDTVRAYAAEAGFERTDVLPIEHDFWRFYGLV
jgi:hypothetical protein